MSTVLQIYEAIDRLAPFSLSMDFDNTGILVGDRQKKVERTLLALDCTKEVLRQAKELGAQLIITHHPIIFHPIKRVNEDSLVYHLLRSDIAVISSTDRCPWSQPTSANNAPGRTKSATRSRRGSSCAMRFSSIIVSSFSVIAFIFTLV